MRTAGRIELSQQHRLHWGVMVDVTNDYAIQLAEELLASSRQAMLSLKAGSRYETAVIPLNAVLQQARNFVFLAPSAEDMGVRFTILVSVLALMGNAAMKNASSVEGLSPEEYTRALANLVRLPPEMMAKVEHLRELL